MATLLPDYNNGEQQRNKPLHYNVEFLVTTKGEVVPFGWIDRLSIEPFNNIDQFADTLATSPNQLNELYAILSDGSNCAFNLIEMAFSQHMSELQHSQYLPTDVIKKLIMLQFAQMNKEMPNENQART